MKKDEILYLK